MPKIVNKCVVCEVATRVNIELTQYDIIKWLESCDASELDMLKDIHKQLCGHIYSLEHPDDGDSQSRA